jgi:hypothetical protein
MDGGPVDRITKALIARLPRRDAAKAFAGSSLATGVAWLGFAETAVGKKKRKRRCRKHRQPCGGRKKCCDSHTKCQDITKPDCDHVTGKRCCGLQGATCDNANGHCDCCDGFFCSGISGLGLCTSTPT